jgi:methanogenic corrinoid protein MtbC1
MSITEWVRMLNEAGFNAMPLGLNYAIEDYVDGSHFSNKASPRMAADVAGMLRKMAGSGLSAGR